MSVDAAPGADPAHGGPCATAIREYLASVFGNAVGTAHVAIGRGGHVTGGGKYGHLGWLPRHYAWPVDAKRMEHDMLAAADTDDVYVGPYLTNGSRRTKGDAVARRIVHADIDDAIDTENVYATGGYAVNSGSHGHGHVYVELTESVTAAQHEALCRGLGKYMGAVDFKVSDNDVLRPPGTLNHKPGGGPVRWLVHPSERVARTPADLARQLHVMLPSADVVTEHPALASVAVQTASCVDLSAHRAVREALAKVTNDRSADIYRVLGTCLDAGLTFDNARHVVMSRPDLAAKLAEVGGDDLTRCWVKLVDKKKRQTIGAPTAPDDATEDAERHDGHLGMAIKMGEQFNGKLRYVNGIGWYRWDGRRWAEDGNGHARRAVHKVLSRQRKAIKRLQLPEEEERTALRRVARFETANAISGILTEAEALEVFSIEVSDLDADPQLFNCTNGTLDLDTLLLRPHDPADLITKIARAAYHPDAQGQDWPRFLARVLPSADDRAYLARLTGTALYGRVTGDKQKLPILTGSGANGKTTWMEAVSHAMGDYAMAAEPTLLMSKRNDAHPTGVADLMGRRLVTVSETQQGHHLDLPLVKRLTGGDTLKARRMRQDFFSFIPSHLLMMATNHLPQIDDDTEAVWRRIRVIRFDVQIPAAERDDALGDRLRMEADAVLGWLVAGWQDYRRRGALCEPPGVLANTSEYQADSDVVGRFIAEQCHTGGAQTAARTTELFSRWETWAAQERVTPMSRKAFGQALTAKGYPAETTGDRLRRGICLQSTGQRVET